MIKVTIIGPDIGQEVTILIRPVHHGRGRRNAESFGERAYENRVIYSLNKSFVIDNIIYYKNNNSSTNHLRYFSSFTI